MFATASYRATSVTLASSSVAYNLGDLLTAVDPNFPKTGREVSIQPVGANTVRIGDPTLSSTLCGFIAANAVPRFYRSNISDIPVGMLWLMGSAVNTVVNVEVSQ